MADLEITTNAQNTAQSFFTIDNLMPQLLKSVEDMGELNFVERPTEERFYQQLEYLRASLKTLIIPIQNYRIHQIQNLVIDSGNGTKVSTGYILLKAIITDDSGKINTVSSVILYPILTPGGKGFTSYYSHACFEAIFSNAREIAKLMPSTLISEVSNTIFHIPHQQFKNPGIMTAVGMVLRYLGRENISLHNKIGGLRKAGPVNFMVLPKTLASEGREVLALFSSARKSNQFFLKVIPIYVEESKLI